MKYYAPLLLLLALTACAPQISETTGAITDVEISEHASEGGVVCNASGNYPHVSNLSSSQIEANINGYLDEYARQISIDMEHCTNQYADLLAKDGTLMENTDIDYIVTRFDEVYLSILLLRSAYMDGAAHPNNMIDAYVFDMTTGQPLALEDLFAKDSNYMTYLENAVREAAEREDIGTYPSDTSNPISTYYVTDTDLVLTDLYFVHAIQAFEVAIPLEDITDMLR